MRIVRPLLILLAVLLPALPASAQRIEERSPFDGIRWTDAGPEVLIEETWYRLRSINHVQTTEIIEFIQRREPGRLRKRFAEDLVATLTAMGRPPPQRVQLELVRLDDGTLVRIPDAPMTNARREALREGAIPVQRVDRPHRSEPHPDFVALATRIDLGDGTRRLTREQAEADLDELEWLLEDRFSYLTLRSVDYGAALDTIRLGLDGGITVEQFALQLQKFIALFGDGHADVRGFESILPTGFTPFLIAAVDGGRLAAVRPSRIGLVDPDHPYLVAMDGRPVAQWLEASARTVARGSPELVRQRSIRGLRFVAYLRRELGLPASDTLEVELASAGGARRAFVVDLAPEKPFYDQWPRMPTRLLPGEIGYLRLSSMSRSAAMAIPGIMEDFADTRALIIDVRGNGGGNRLALLALLPHLMTPDAAPVVVNAARYRRSSVAEPGMLADRRLLPADDPSWPPAHRAAIEAFVETFAPRWRPPEEDFSPLHCFVIGPDDAGPGIARYPVRRPVVVLMNSDCFSATDVFLGALKGQPRVTLLGEPSAGGSGRRQTVRLTHSSIALRLSSMASWQPDGQLYDTVGVTPDVRVEPIATDHIFETDTQLDAALELLNLQER